MNTDSYTASAYWHTAFNARTREPYRDSRLDWRRCQTHANAVKAAAMMAGRIAKRYGWIAIKTGEVGNGSYTLICDGQRIGYVCTGMLIAL